MNWGWCHNRLAVGGSPMFHADVDELLAAGVSFVINCRTKVEDASLYEWVKTIRCPVDDDGTAKGCEWFADPVSRALAELSSPGHKVFVHCYHGSNRGPSLALAILMAQGLDFGEAYRLVKKAMPDATVRYAEDAARAVHQLGYW